MFVAGIGCSVDHTHCNKQILNTFNQLSLPIILAFLIALLFLHYLQCDDQIITKQLGYTSFPGTTPQVAYIPDRV